MVASSVPSGSTGDESLPVLLDSADLPFDWDRFLARCLGNQAFAERILAKFFRLFSDDFAEIEQAQRTGDGESLARVAHRLKGSAANISAVRLRNVLATIEHHGRQHQLEALPPYLELLRSEWALFVEHVHRKNRLSRPLNEC